MLKNLHISNYALIEKLDINFPEGFSVITGETGAGKSIILGALGLLLGGRADAKAIKTGASKCCVEGTFDVKKLDLSAFFEENDIDFDGEECIIRREVNAAGKSRAFVNDSPVSLAKVKEVCQAVIDIHSQHQNLLMGNEMFLTDTLDTIAGNKSIFEHYQQAYKLWIAVRKELEELKAQAEKDRTDNDYLQFQLQQLVDANLQEGEQEDLEQESETLGHAEEIKEALFQAANALSENDNEQSPVSRLKQGIQTLEGIAKVSNTASLLAERLESIRIELEDISSELERAVDRIEFDPERLAFVDDRLGLIYDLEKRHHVENISQLLCLIKELRQRLDLTEQIDEIIAKKEAETENLFKSLIICAKRLTESRQKAADHTSSVLSESIAFLGMPNAKLHFEFKQRLHPETSGCDNITFFFSANKNVPEQDVTQIASGGEIARLMLALKALTSTKRNLPTIIFDEIDTGVSGTMAEKMANVMQKMAQNCQVICITHLPQIAALGDSHYRVYKSENENNTTSHIDQLNNDERIKEIAKMLSGAEITQAAIDNARSLLHLTL